jgi:hypothetical protein
VHARRLITIVRIAAALFALAWAPKSHAADHPEVRLVYVRDEGAATCPGEQEVAAAVAERLGYIPFSPSSRQTVLARAWGKPNHWHGSIERLGEQAGGRRELASNAAECSDLATSMALSIALLLDPDRAMGVPMADSPKEPIRNPVEEPPPESKESPALEPKVEAAPPLAMAPEPKIEWAVGIGAVASLGTAPIAAVGAGALVEMRLRAFRAGLEGRADLPAEGAESGGVGVRTQLTSAMLVPCYATRIVSMCALASLGSIRAEGVGSATRPRNASAIYSAVGGRVGVDLPMGSTPLVLRLTADVLAPITQLSFTVSDERVWSLSSLAGAVGLGGVIVLQ